MREDRAPRKHKDIKVSCRKGLIMVHTGSGKGKTTAALGTALRALGRGKRVGIVQFIKGKWTTGEVKFLKRFADQCHVFTIGDGFTWKTQNFEQDVMTACKAWAQCLKLLNDNQYFLVIFDEINYCFKYNFLDVTEVIAALKSKPPLKHIILTGNGAPPEIIALADLVTEMKCIKHPYQKGLKAQPGIEY